MSQRISRLRERIPRGGYPLSIEKFRLITESYQATTGQATILRRAAAMAHVLDHIPIFIEEDQLLLGNAASRPFALEFDFYGGLWSEDEIDGLWQSGYEISEEDRKQILDMNRYWKNFNPIAQMGALFNDRLWEFMQTGLLLPPWKNREEGPGGGYAESGLGLGPGFYIVTPDYEKVLQSGLRHLIDDARSALERLPMNTPDALARNHFYRSVIRTNEAVIRFARRYSALAYQVADETQDPRRQAELRRLGDICGRVPERPARDFHEALQSLWFIFLMVTPSPTASFGRFDQYMYPFYRRSVEEKGLTEEQTLELLQCLRIKDMSINRTSGASARQKNAGMAKWHNMTIGGVTPSGSDAANDLSYLVLDAIIQCPTPHHTVTIRVGETTPAKLIRKGLEVVKTGIGMPAFVGDRSYIEYLLSEGVPLSDARNYAMGGCIDATLPGKSRISAYGMFIVPKVLELALFNGRDPRTGIQLGPESGRLTDFESFADVMAAFKKQLYCCLELHAEKNNIELLVYRDLFPDPFRSSLMDRAIEAGKPLLERRFEFENGAVMNPVGMVNVIDSLAAVKTCLFEEKTVSAQALMEAVASDWQGGQNERIRKQMLAAPKFGNNDERVDLIAEELFHYWAETAARFSTCLGGTHKPTGVSISAQWPGGAITGATPDGRRAGECLADGTVSAMRGRDIKGPTAVLNSAARVDQAAYQAALLNLKFHPSALAGEADLAKLAVLIRTYFSRNGKHLQFNVVDRKTLLEAQEAPDAYQDLIVRIAGYSARFVQLGKPMQDEIIGRTAHQGMF